MDENKTAFVRVYHHSGLQVSVPIAWGAALSPADVQQLSANVDTILANGFTVSAPGQVEGDLTDIAYVVRGQGSNKDGGMTDRIWMYAPWGDDDKGSQLTVYLNTPDDAAAFEKASGLKVASLPICKGKSGPLRQSGDFERNARKVQFAIIRAQKEDKDSIAGYKWELKQYVAKAPPAPSERPTQPPPASSASTAPTGTANGASREPLRIDSTVDLDAALDTALKPEVHHADVYGITWRNKKDGSGKYYQLTGLGDDDVEIRIVAFDLVALDLLGFDLRGIKKVDDLRKGYNVRIPYTKERTADGTEYLLMDGAQVRADKGYTEKIS